MKYLACLASFLFLFSCYGTSYTAHPDVDFPPDLLIAARGAAADWEANVPVKITFDGAPCAVARPADVMCLHAVASLPQVPWEPGLTLAGFDVLADIWLAAPILEGGSAAYRQGIVAHEMGHAMGLQHTGLGTLMYPSAGGGGSSVVTPADVAQWRAVRGIK